MRILARLFLGLLLAGVGATAYGQPSQPSAIQQLKNNPPGGRLAIGLPAVPPATLRDPRSSDTSLTGAQVGDYWLGPTGTLWINLTTTAGGTNGLATWAAVIPQPVPRPLDNMLVAPRAAFFMKRLSSTYVGNAFQIRKLSGGATLDVAFLQNDLPDLGSAMAFCPAAGQCEYSIWYGQVGGFNATCVTGSCPMFDSTRFVQGILAVSYQSVKNHVVNGPALSNICMTIDAGATFTAQTSSWMMAGSLNNSASAADTQGLFSNDAGTYGWSNSNNNDGGLTGIGMSLSTVTFQIPVTPSAFLVVAAATNFRVFVGGNAQAVSHPSATPGSSAGGKIGCNNTDGGAVMDITGFVLWDAQLSSNLTEPVDMIPIEVALGIRRQYDNLVVMIGASDCSGTGSSIGTSWPQEMLPLLTAGTLLVNNCVHGATLSNTLSNIAALGGFPYSSYRGVTARNVVFDVTVLGNDVRQGDSYATILANSQAIVTALRAIAPANARIILNTIPLPCDYVADPAKVAVLQQVNDSRSSSLLTAPVSAGGWGADALADQFANTLVSAGDYVTSLYCSQNVSYDNVHLRNGGVNGAGAVPHYQASVAFIHAPVINGLLR